MTGTAVCLQGQQQLGCRAGSSRRAVSVFARGGGYGYGGGRGGGMNDPRESLILDPRAPLRGGPGGGRGAGGRGGPGGGGLIIPGRQAPGRPGAPGQQQRLLIDEEDNEIGDGLDIEPGSQPAISGVTGAPPTINKFRPPPGFMSDSVSADDSLLNMTNEEMITRLRAQAAPWHRLAKMLPVLSSRGWDATVVDSETGITPATQNLWLVASTVYDSLAASSVSEDLLTEFSDESGAEKLYPFRFLGNEARVLSAEYIVQKRLEPPMCEVLARSMKEWERRPGERTGFSFIPGDCLAFKYLRDAGECRKREEALAKLQQAMKVVITEEGRQRLEDVIAETSGERPAPAQPSAASLLGLDEDAQVGSGASAAASSPYYAGVVPGSVPSEPLTTLRLDPDELGYRPVPVLGALGEVRASALDSAPKATQEGAFGMFTITPGSRSSGEHATKWVALPQWKALAMARNPVGLTVSDCLDIAPVVATAKIRSDDDKRRMRGPGMLVADRAPESVAEALKLRKAAAGSSSSPTGLTSSQQGAWFLWESDGPAPGAGGGRVALVDAATALSAAERGSGRVVAVALFLARPPNRDTMVQGTDMLQV